MGRVSGALSHPTAPKGHGEHGHRVVPTAWLEREPLLVMEWGQARPLLQGGNHGLHAWGAPSHSGDSRGPLPSSAPCMLACAPPNPGTAGGPGIPSRDVWAAVSVRKGLLLPAAPESSWTQEPGTDVGALRVALTALVWGPWDQLAHPVLVTGWPGTPLGEVLGTSRPGRKVSPARPSGEDRRALGLAWWSGFPKDAGGAGREAGGRVSGINSGSVPALRLHRSKAEDSSPVARLEPRSSCVALLWDSAGRGQPQARGPGGERPR